MKHETFNGVNVCVSSGRSQVVLSGERVSGAIDSSLTNQQVCWTETWLDQWVVWFHFPKKKKDWSRCCNTSESFLFTCQAAFLPEAESLKTVEGRSVTGTVSKLTLKIHIQNKFYCTLCPSPKKGHTVAWRKVAHQWSCFNQAFLSVCENWKGPGYRTMPDAFRSPRWNQGWIMRGCSCPRIVHVNNRCLWWASDMPEQ